MESGSPVIVIGASGPVVRVGMSGSGAVVVSEHVGWSVAVTVTTVSGLVSWWLERIIVTFQDRSK